MRLFITIAVVTLALSCWARPADDDYSNYDDETPVEPSPSPPPKAPARHALIGSRTARGPSPLIGSRGKTTTTTPPPKPAEPEEVNEPESLDEEAGEEVEEQAPVTTEAPKKGLKAGVVRPFRSNQDLLAALKRKRQQEHSSGSVSTHPPAATPAPEQKATSKGSSRNSGGSSSGSSNGRRSFSRSNNKAAPAAPEAVDEAEPPKKPAFGSSSRRFSGRGKPAAPAPVNEDPEGEEEEAPRAAKSYRGGRRI